MIGEGQKRIEGSLTRVAKLSSVASFLFATLFAVSFIIGFASIVGFVAVSFLDPSNSKNWLDCIFDIIPLMLLWIITSASLWIAFCIIRDMARSGSPFTKKHANRLKLLGIAALVGVFVETVVSPEARMSMSYGLLDIETHPSSFSEFPAIPINGQSLIFGLICLCFSLAFEYGALLQKLSDETV